ncbi:MAG: tetratricopeptide repeat protein [Candidatus Omnitrophota bacterium]
MRKQSFFRSTSLVFLALAVFFICSHPSSYATDAENIATAEQCVKDGAEAMQKNDVDKALESFNKAVSLDPKNLSVYVGLGNAYFQKGDADKALESFNKAISLNSKSLYAYIGLGNLYLQKGNIDKAIDSFNKAISLDPKDPQAHSSLGHLYIQKGDKDAALKQHKILSDLDKKLAEQLDKRIQAFSPKPQ